MRAARVGSKRPSPFYGHRAQPRGPSPEAASFGVAKYGYFTDGGGSAAGSATGLVSLLRVGEGDGVTLVLELPRAYHFRITHAFIT